MSILLEDQQYAVYYCYLLYMKKYPHFSVRTQRKIIKTRMFINVSTSVHLENVDTYPPMYSTIVGIWTLGPKRTICYLSNLSLSDPRRVRVSTSAMIRLHTFLIIPPLPTISSHESTRHR